MRIQNFLISDYNDNQKMAQKLESPTTTFRISK